METFSAISVGSPARVQTRTKLSSIVTKEIVLGYCLLAVSAGLFWVTDLTINNTEKEGFTIFIVHYVMALTYVFYLMAADMYGFKTSWRKENLSQTIILLNLFLVSAFALNRVMTVFEESVNWLCVVICMTSFTTMSFAYCNVLPRWVNKIQYFFLGGAALLYIYLALFVVRIYSIGTVGILFFGIGTHVFVPVTFIVATIYLIKYNEERVNYRWLVAGLVVSILFVSAFAKEWNKRGREIDRLSNQSVLKPESQLPVWIRIGQWIPADWITHRLLRSGLVYTTRAKDDGEWFFMPNRFSWSESRKHDPLVFIASHFSTTSLSTEDRLRIIQAISGARHNAEERLWQGDNLSTSYVVSDIEMFPEFRLAYTEKYLNIRNSAVRGWRGNSQEAIYTFQLPEGSVVTSLSLWIEGKEEKGILTSKQKAQEAYETIVGRERRDPSMIHWQEGNTVSVRVFPCTPDEERKFKIGITSPLIKEDGKIVYKNITFQGPSVADAKETIRVSLSDGANSANLPDGFISDKNGDFVHEGEYNPDFEFEFDDMPLKSHNHFTFQGNQYSLELHEPVNTQFVASDIYLDVNDSWYHRELEFFRGLSDERNIFVFVDNQFVKLSEGNWDLVNDLKSHNFSIFPFHLLSGSSNILVVTKGERVSPYLRDIKDSAFGDALRGYFASGKTACVYNLGNDIPMYIRSLREFRAFDFASGDIGRLNTLLLSNKFPRSAEDDNTVVLHDSHLKISKSNATGKTGNAPDHLARLFAYNDIMRRVGVTYFTQDFVNDELVAEASKAYVVSPVSSLIVLETKEDYERFDIKDAGESLQNAARAHSGAVPEPHEWVLIALFGLFVLVVTLRHTKFFPIP